MKSLMSYLKSNLYSFTRLIFGPLYYILQKTRIKHKTRDELWEFWKHPTQGDGKNLPTNYLQGEEKSQYLVELIKRYAEPNAEILEIGCNIGRNLNYLFNAGYTKLGG